RQQRSAGKLIDQLTQQWQLSLGNLAQCFGRGEPSRAIDFGKGSFPARAGRPFNLEGVALDCVSVDVVLDGPGFDQLTAGDLHRGEWDESSFDLEAGLLLELALSRRQRLLVGVDLALRDRPGAIVLILPEGAAGVDEEELRTVGTEAVGEDTGTALR